MPWDTQYFLFFFLVRIHINLRAFQLQALGISDVVIGIRGSNTSVPLNKYNQIQI